MITTKLLLATAVSGLLLTFCSCASREPKPLDITGMSKDQIKVEVARLELEERKLDDRREDRKAWWQGVAKSAGTMAVEVSANWLRAWLSSGSDGLSKDR